MSGPNTTPLDLSAFDEAFIQLYVHGHNKLADRLDALQTQIAPLLAELARLQAMINSPITLEYLRGTANEIVHQVERWGTVHDRAKEPQDWFWLVGYLAGKALAAHLAGNTEKALHHTISTGAALGNWHAHIRLGTSEMQPGSSDLQQFLESAFGADAVAKLGDAP